MTELIPFSRVIERVRKLANDYPERVAECQYFNVDGSPCCIFGHVFAELGCVLENTRPDSISVGKYITKDGSTLCAEGTVIDNPHGEIRWDIAGVASPSQNEEHWALEVQDLQDGGSSWGFAVGSVDEDFQRRGISV